LNDRSSIEDLGKYFKEFPDGRDYYQVRPMDSNYHSRKQRAFQAFASIHPPEETVNILKAEDQ
jgi:hypothetical protein